MWHNIGNSGCSWGPTHKSHKIVAARKILAIQRETFDNQPVTRFIFDGNPSVTVADTELVGKPTPTAGMYMVAYGDENNYFSFSPAKQFEEGYTRLAEVGIERSIASFGWALKQLHNGSRVRRSGWNGKGMYVALQVPDEHSKMGRPYLYIKSVDGLLVPWVPSQTDILGSDWEIAE